MKLDNIEEKDCAFQYAKIPLYGRTEIVCDKTGITLTEAKDLWNKHYPDCAKHIKNDGTSEMVIWINMVDENSFGDTLQYISTDAESDGSNIWVTTKTNFPKTIK